MASDPPIANRSDWRLARRIGALARSLLAVSYRRSVLALTFLLLSSLTEGISIVVLIPVLELISHHAAPSSPKFLAQFGINSIDFNHLGLPAVLLIFAGLVCLSAQFSRFKTIYMADFLLDALNRLRTDLFESIAAARWSAVAKLRTSDLDHVLTGDIDRVQAAATSTFLLLQAGVFLVLYAAISAAISFKMTAFAAIAGALMFVALRSLRKRGVIFGDQLTRERQHQYRTINDFLSSLKVTKSYNSEERYSVEFQKILLRLKKGTLEFVKISTLSGFLLQCIGVVAGCIFIYTSFAIFGVSFSRIIVLILVFTRVMPRFNDIQDQGQTIITNLPAYENMKAIQDYCDQEREISTSLEDAAMPAFTQELRFEDVSFGYGEQLAVRNLNFVIPYGQITALVGVSGSGKSTIADLAMGLQFPTEGKILVDGVELSEQNSRPWRAQVSYVPQDTFLIAASIETNINIAGKDVTTSQIVDALAAAHALDFVETLPGGASTPVGDGGLRLSGGERQRIAIARALLRNPRLIIMDEATSALDSENTLRVVETVRALRGGTTVLIITHNITVQECADNVITIANGTTA